VDYHGGVEMILHQWGTPLHYPPQDLSPDQTAMEALGQRMRSFAGPFHNFYQLGTANELLGAVYGPLDDTSYATGWDPNDADPVYPSPGRRAVAYTVEISDIKNPAASTLGGDADVLTPGGAEDGYVPKSLRVGLAAIDIAEPYVVWTNRAQEPVQALPDEDLTVEWQVRGCFQVDETRVRMGLDPDLATSFTSQSPLQAALSGEPCFGGPVTFHDHVAFPIAGTYYLAPVARVDSFLTVQQNPNPPLDPQSWLVQSRVQDGLLYTNDVDPNEVNTVQAHRYWSAPPLQVVVSGTPATPTPTAVPLAAPRPGVPGSALQLLVLLLLAVALRLGAGGVRPRRSP
jgi:hypothetical protein